ncbi:hypothetical protein BCR44DRAFT_43794, partial [Catenaria anguillulae PL171]
MRSKNIPSQPPASSSASARQSGSFLSSTFASSASSAGPHHDKRQGKRGKGEIISRSQFVSSLSAESQLPSTLSPGA